MVATKVSSLDWANFIMGAVGTVAALVVAIILGLHQARRFRQDAVERDRERRARE